MPIEVRDDRLRQLIVELEGKFSSSGIRKALENAGAVGLREARALVPKVTGTLEKSIYANVISDNTLALGAKADYAAYVEYGTSKQNAQPFIEPAAQAAAYALEASLLELIMAGETRGRPTTTGSGTYTPTGNKVGRPGSGKTKLHKEASRPKGQHKYISKRKSTRGTWIYDYGDQGRLRTGRSKVFDRAIRGTGRANRGRR